jgi:GMP synthase (glutamine-hydrolysing)
MKLHWLQHVPFEGLGYIEDWAAERGFSISCTRLYQEEDEFPDFADFDWLVVMGGPMGINDYNDYPWLTEEKEFIGTALDEEKTVIGICLGAQLIADVLGANVYPGPHKEIGWFPLHRSVDAPEWFPEAVTAFHWHGDTFDLPEGAVHLASSEAFENQGFIYLNRVLGLQFHMESTSESIEDLITHCGDELTEGSYVQTPPEIRSANSNIHSINTALSRLLDHLPAR